MFISRTLVLVLLLMVIPVTGQAQNNSKTIIMRIMAVQGEGMAYVRQLRQLQKNIEERTHGQIAVELLINGVGGSEADALKNQTNGTVEGGWISGLAMAQTFRAFRALMLPLVFNDIEQINSFIDSPLDQTVRSTTLSKNLLVLGYGSYGFYGIMFFDTRVPTNGHNDGNALEIMRDRTVLVPGDQWVEAVQGSLPGKVKRTPGLGLKQVIDAGGGEGLLVTPEMVSNTVWTGKASHFLNLRHLHGWSVFSVNRVWFETLSAKHQQIVKQEVRAMCQRALSSGLTFHDTLVQKWYSRRQPMVVQASWDRMAAMEEGLVKRTSLELEGFLASKGRIRLLWEANYRLIPPPNSPIPIRNSSVSSNFFPDDRGVLANVMNMNLPGEFGEP
ncbi:MAG: TRAP transporter substrate-binding protein DctP [Magnetococcales bacterium]|nr:TRAP transporter substrate-binding protein DctP [Magnetococcales bacterium]